MITTMINLLSFVSLCLSLSFFVKYRLSEKQNKKLNKIVYKNITLISLSFHIDFFT